MLTARRDPSFHPGTQDAAHAAHPGHAAQSTSHGPGFNRFMTVLQVAGSLLAIPLGLASGYSIYHANFSAEARCQGLRANIISMLDKSADASTLRMLVRRDVADFETSCGAVDPDAVAAFKTLLAHGKQAAPAAAPEKQAAHEPVRAVKEAAKPAPAKPALAEAKRPRRDAATSDANWVASVREALIHAPAVSPERAEGEELPAVAPAPVRAVAPRETRAPALSLAPPAAASAAPAPRQAAPALPPAASVAAMPAPAPAPDHPVPPASIPDAAPMATASVQPVRPAHSGIRGLIADIPLLGRVVGQ